MIRLLALALLASSLAACATMPKSETEALLSDVLHNRSAPLNCAAEMYCVTTGTRISTAKNSTCSCMPPAALNGRRLTR